MILQLWAQAALSDNPEIPFGQTAGDTREGVDQGRVVLLIVESAHAQSDLARLLSRPDVRLPLIDLNDDGVCDRDHGSPHKRRKRVPDLLRDTGYLG